MKKIVVTGASGFIGKNLMVHLNGLKDIQLRTITRSDGMEEYNKKLRDVDIVFHLAGVNRPKEESEFSSGNAGLTKQLIRHLSGPIKFVMTSSTQAAQDNPYGRSKLAAEQEIAKAVKENKIEGIIFRLPGVFGKWCKPNYNSVVATFCHNIAYDLPINISDPNHQLTLVYIDHVIAALMQQIDLPAQAGNLMRLEVSTKFSVTLGELREMIQDFLKCRQSLYAPKVANTLQKYLYSTFLSYLPQDLFSYSMKLKTDNRGDLFEWIKSADFGQIFVSTTKPGITRGNHFHHTKTEKFLVIRGKAVIRFRKIGEKQMIEYSVSGEEPNVVDIPPGYTHNITNIGNNELITLFWANEVFDPEKPDTYFEEV